MKKHLIFISITLLTMTTVKLVGMEENKSPIQENTAHSKALKKLYSLTNISPEVPIQDILSALTNFVTTTENQFYLRENIFALTTLLTVAPHEKNSDLKNIRTLMYNRLTMLFQNEKKFLTTEEAKIATKEFCYGVIDDISDDDESSEKDYYTQNNFLKYQNITGQTLDIEKKQNSFIVTHKLLQSAKITKERKIEILAKKLKNAQTAIDEFNHQITRNKEESNLLATAHAILRNKASNQLEKMHQQKAGLIKEINCINNLIATLQKEEIAKNSTEIIEARIKLHQLQNVLSYLNKNLAEAEGKTTFLENFGWTFGLYEYDNFNQNTKEN